MILSALNDYYQRLAAQGRVPIPGYSREKVSYALILSSSGELLDVADVRETSGKKPMPKSLQVPQPEKRTVAISPNFLWDKTSYVLGVTGKEGGGRPADEHKAFSELHRRLLAECDDPGARALLAFLGKWHPDQFTNAPFSIEMLDTNVVFRLDTELGYLHDRPALQAIWSKTRQEANTKQGKCLVTGIVGPLARLHPSIKGVDGAQSSGASIISFNLDAFNSYGKEQGSNAPVSDQVAFSYTTALNYLLRRGPDNRQRIQIGDATVVFWALADKPESAECAELTFAELLSPPADDEQESARLHSVLDAVAKGRPIHEIDPGLDERTQFFVLGLSPNASRLSIRYWQAGTLGMFVQRMADHYRDLHVEPLPWKTAPAMWRLLHATAPSRDGKSRAEDISPQLAGELARAILTGARYPHSLLANVLMRMRADHDISGIRVALCKGVLARDQRLKLMSSTEEVHVSLDKDASNPGYRLGRLFAVLEGVQHAALPGISATIRDRYFGAASATPASVFPILLRNAQNHLGRLRKDKPGLAVTFEREIAEVIDGFPTLFPRSLRLEDQGRFAIGYYHQTKARFGKSAAADDTTETENEGEQA